MSSLKKFRNHSYRSEQRIREDLGGSLPEQLRNICLLQSDLEKALPAPEDEAMRVSLPT